MYEAFYGYIGMYVGLTNTERTTLGIYINPLGNVGIGTAGPAVTVAAEPPLVSNPMLPAGIPIQRRNHSSTVSST